MVLGRTLGVKEMEAMGPEAAMLSARLAEYRATKTWGNLEFPDEDPIYVVASVYAHRGDGVRHGGYPRRRPIWARLRVTLHLVSRRKVREAEPVVGIAGAPIGKLPEVGRVAGADGTGGLLAGMPLRWEAQR